MKITAIETFCLRYDMPYPLTYARGEYAQREALLVKVRTDDDSAIFGWGESAMWGGPHGVTATVIEREIAPLIIGQDPRRPEYLWEKVFQETYYHGRRGILLAALSGVDIALWDILGKCAGQPLWRLLGGFGRPVSAYASAGYYRRDYGLDAFAADVAKARAAGFRGYKMKIGNIPQAVHYGVLPDVPMRLSIDEDLKRVATAREAIGGDRNLMVDATTSLTPRVAMRYAESLEPLNIRWFEEPVLAEDVAGCAELARAHPHRHRRLRDRDRPRCLRPADRRRRHPGGAARYRAGRRHHRSAQDRRLRPDPPSALHQQELQHHRELRRLPASALCLAQWGIFRMRPGSAALAQRDPEAPRLSPGERHGRARRRAGVGRGHR